MVAKGEKKSFMVPDNDNIKNIWFWIDLKSISEFINETIGEYYIIRADDNSGEIPIGKNLNIQLRNDHLKYAIIWFTLAASLAAMSIMFIRKELKKQRLKTSN